VRFSHDGSLSLSSAETASNASNKTRQIVRNDSSETGQDVAKLAALWKRRQWNQRLRGWRVVCKELTVPGKEGHLAKRIQTMNRTETSTEMHEGRLTEQASAAWGGARATTQAVAFRVIEVVEEADGGRSPIWGPSPLTAEEEAILLGLTESG
jgi:hypothetical protein